MGARINLESPMQEVREWTITGAPGAFRSRRPLAPRVGLEPTTHWLTAMYCPECTLEEVWARIAEHLPFTYALSPNTYARQE